MPSETAGEQGPDITETTERLRALLAASEDVPTTCESCGAIPTVRLDDGSAWCGNCHESALSQGYDDDEGEDIDWPGMVAACRAEIDHLNGEVTSWSRMYLDSVKRWHATCDEALKLIAAGKGLTDVVDLIGYVLDGSDALDDDVIALLLKAKAVATGEAPVAPKAEGQQAITWAGATPATPERVACPDCDGTGAADGATYVPDDEFEPCPTCWGSLHVPATPDTEGEGE